MSKKTVVSANHEYEQIQIAFFVPDTRSEQPVIEKKQENTTIVQVLPTPMTTMSDVMNDNFKVLARYRQHCRNKGLTSESVKALCNVDIPLFLKWLGNKRVEDVTHFDIEDYLTYCADDRGNQQQTIARKYTSVNGFFKAIVKLELIEGMLKNPVDKVDKPKVRRKQRGHLTLEEYQQLLNYIDSIGDLRGGALVSFYFSSACRLTEGWQQNRDSLDYETRRFKVLGKGDKERTCVFSEDAKQRILKYLASRTDSHEALFYSRQKGRLTKRSIERYVAKAGIEAGLTKHVHPHLFRHTRAMALLRQDVPLDKIQKLLGHESIATTQIYAHTNIDDVQSVVDQLDSLA